ncbi:M23 family metallopeptidase [Sphingomonas sp. LHG3406-1]|uniref:M23 family metallopeptidase n=1 Tax=Sphingomonas sp. LHG3406-1 TaxID=2804617 RepID=UPI00262F7EF5|nr:M23 family metallopeptidase [Sphingomonas sp. LHG3406-1]
MRRLSLLTWSLALLSLGAGTIGYSTSVEVAEAEPGESAPAGTGEVMAQPVAAPADAQVLFRADSGLAALLLEAKVAGLDAVLAETAAESLPPLAGRPVQLWLGAPMAGGARPIKRLEYRREGGRKISIERSGDAFVARVTVETVDETPVRVRLAGGPALAGDMVAMGLPGPLRRQVEEAVSGSAVASLDLVVAHEQEGQDRRFGPMLYLGLHRPDGTVQRWLGEGGELRKVDLVAPEAGMLRPIPGPITSTPGLRVHPILRYLRWHRGTDFGAPAGTPVQAALGGQVAEAGWRGGYGRVVRLRHRDGSATLYAHLDSIAVTQGQEIAKGALLGAVGASGLATGPHLHFEWVRGGETLHPRFAAPGMQVGALSQSQRAALRSVLAVPYRPASRT